MSTLQTLTAPFRHILSQLSTPTALPIPTPPPQAAPTPAKAGQEAATHGGQPGKECETPETRDKASTTMSHKHNKQEKMLKNTST